MAGSGRAHRALRANLAAARAGIADAERIITRYIYPPIPDRRYDWMAFYDSDGEEAGRYGYGATEAEAIADLTENHEER